MSRAFSKARRALTQRLLKRRAGMRLGKIIVACKLKGEIAHPGCTRARPERTFRRKRAFEFRLISKRRNYFLESFFYLKCVTLLVRTLRNNLTLKELYRFCAICFGGNFSGVNRRTLERNCCRVGKWVRKRSCTLRLTTAASLSN